MHQRPISFPRWKQVLAESAFSPQLKAAYTREILTFLKYCKAGHAAATVELAKQYLDWREKQSSGPAREALRWFYKECQKLNSPGPAVPLPPAENRRFSSRPMEPPPAASDLGSEPWERDLIKAIRERGFLWRTEQTYREWAAYRLRHAAFAP